MNVCLLVEGGQITVVDAGLPGSSLRSWTTSLRSV